MFKPVLNMSSLVLHNLQAVFHHPIYLVGTILASDWQPGNPILIVII